MFFSEYVLEEVVLRIDWVKLEDKLSCEGGHFYEFFQLLTQEL